jgi:zinc/manganese transport system permease protein
VDLASSLTLPFAQHALAAGFLIALICGMIGPFVIARQMAFAVHGAAELSFTGASAGLLIAGNPVAGALLGSVVVAATMGLLGERSRERDSVIGVVLAAGLGLGVFLLSRYQGFASAATNILFGNIFGISWMQIMILGALAIGVTAVMVFIYRPLLFASVDPELAQARGVPLRLLGIVFLVVLALSVTEAAQVVGTLLVLSLAITPAAAAQRIARGPASTTMLSIAIALLATELGLVLALVFSTVPPTVFISAISFSSYFAARLVGPGVARRRRERLSRLRGDLASPSQAT